jgi:hypothetical protein
MGSIRLWGWASTYLRVWIAIKPWVRYGVEENRLPGNSDAGLLGRRTLSARYYGQEEEEGYTQKPPPDESQYAQPRI